MKLRKIINEENLLTTKKYKWSAFKDGDLIKSGIVELTNHELESKFGTINLKSLIDKWNRQGKINNSKGLTWEYEIV